MIESVAPSANVKVSFAEQCIIAEPSVLARALLAVMELITEPVVVFRLERCLLGLTRSEGKGPDWPTSALLLDKKTCLDLCAELFSLAEELVTNEVLGGLAIEAVAHRVLEAILTDPRS